MKLLRLVEFTARPIPKPYCTFQTLPMTSTVLELAVTVYSGRHFPRLPAGHTVRIQATVDNQVRETMPSQIRAKGGGGRVSTLGPQPVWQDGGRLVWQITKEAPSGDADMKPWPM